MRVAIVNDLPIALEALRRAVAQYPGATIAWSAMDGEEAVRQCRADRPDMILMDLIMPRMDGVEATRRIRAWERENGRAPVPIIALTAHAMQEYRARTLAAGCTGYLTKPFHPRALQDAVAAALDHGREKARVAPAS